jgi:hypothetical protein
LEVFHIDITYAAIYVFVRRGMQTHLARHMSTREEILDSKMDASDAETQEVIT